MNRLDSATPSGDTGPYMPNWKYFYPFYRAPSPPRPSPAGALYDVRAQLPPELARDPKAWTRQNVQTWLEWCQEEFDLPSIDCAQFALNGKALCLLLRSDFVERAPRAGDILYNVIQILLKEAVSVNNHCPPQLRLFDYANGNISNSELVRNSEGSAWPVISSDYHNLGHVLHQPRLQVSPSTSGVESTVTLSPAPSTDSHSESPRQQSSPTSIGQHSPDAVNDKHTIIPNGMSDFEDSGNDSPVPSMLVDTEMKPAIKSVIPETITPTEPITNGRLLWDFLHQLLNDPAQRYLSCIHWKNRESGVFKITEPNGLARLWGMQKNHLNMNFDKMSRALRYYYRVNILRKVQGERHCYQFLRQPTELKACKQRALLHKFCNNDQPLDMSMSTNVISNNHGMSNGHDVMVNASANIKTEDIDQ